VATRSVAPFVSFFFLFSPPLLRAIKAPSPLILIVDRPPPPPKKQQCKHQIAARLCAALGYCCERADVPDATLAAMLLYG
jgi:hypothetical protein